MTRTKIVIKCPDRGCKPVPRTTKAHWFVYSTICPNCNVKMRVEIEEEEDADEEKSILDYAGCAPNIIGNMTIQEYINWVREKDPEMTHGEILNDVCEVLAIIEAHFLLRRLDTPLSDDEESLLDLVSDTEEKVKMHLALWEEVQDDEG